MDFKDKLKQSDHSYDIYNINKAEIKHLPYSLRVLFENYIRNNKSDSSDVIDKFMSWNGSIPRSNRNNLLSLAELSCKTLLVYQQLLI